MTDYYGCCGGEYGGPHEADCEDGIEATREMHSAAWWAEQILSRAEEPPDSTPSYAEVAS